MFGDPTASLSSPRPAALGMCSTWNTCCSTELTWGLRTPQGTQPCTSVPFITRCDCVYACMCAYRCPCAVLAYLSSPVCYILGACSVACCELWPSRPTCAHLLPEHTLHVCSKQPGMNCAHLGFLGQVGPVCVGYLSCSSLANAYGHWACRCGWVCPGPPYVPQCVLLHPDCAPPAAHL